MGMSAIFQLEPLPSLSFRLRCAGGDQEDGVVALHCSHQRVSNVVGAGGIEAKPLFTLQKFCIFPPCPS